MKKIGHLTASLLAICVCTLGGLSAVDAQDEKKLDLVDQHGKKVDVEELASDSNPKQQPAGKQRRIDLRWNDGKIMVVDRDGEVREIDVSDARNVFIRKSVQSTTENGQEKRKIAGKAIIIGPDGQRQEFVINDDGLGEKKLAGGKLFETLPFARQLFNKPMAPVQFEFAAPSIGKYMIGVSCSPVSDQLRSHLDLDEGIGLVVSSEPRAGTPAATAGLKRHDILLEADGSGLAANSDLMEVVNVAGEEDKALSIKVVRRGEEIEVELKPTIRQNSGSRFEFGPNFQFERVGPGVLFENRENASVRWVTRLQELDKRIEELSSIQEDLLRSIQSQDAQGDRLRRRFERRTEDDR